MDTTEAMRETWRRSGLTSRAISEAMGRAPSWLSATLAKPRTSEAATVAALARVCGCELCIVPRDDVPQSAIVIDPPEGSR